MNDNWFEFVSKIIERDKEKISVHTLERPKGVTAEEVSQAENILGFTIPIELKSLLMEFDGLHEYAIKEDGRKISLGSIIWSLSDIVNWHTSWTIPNKTMLFCFGNSISANPYGYLLENGKPKEDEIWQSDHETSPPNEDIIKRGSSLKEFISTSMAESRWY